MSDADEITPHGSHYAEPVTVLVDDRRLVGYLIRSDAVLVMEPDVRLPAIVFVNDREVAPIEAHRPGILDPETLEPSDTYRWTALQLPDGTVDVPGERIPPGVDVPISDEPGKGHGARRSMWCWFFPRLRGC